MIVYRSGTPPTRVATDGTPQAMASRAARPKDSIWLGMIMRSAGKELINVVLLAEEVDAILDVVAEGKLLGGAAVGAIADKHEARGKSAGDACEDLNDVKDPLYGAEVGEVDEEAFVRCRKLRTHFGDKVGFADVDVAVDEVADNFYFAFDAEGFVCTVGEVLRDGCDAVGLFDAEAGDGEVGGVRGR